MGDRWHFSAVWTVGGVHENPVRGSDACRRRHGKTRSLRFDSGETEIRFGSDDVTVALCSGGHFLSGSLRVLLVGHSASRTQQG